MCGGQVPPSPDLKREKNTLEQEDATLTLLAGGLRFRNKEQIGRNLAGKYAFAETTDVMSEKSRIRMAETGFHSVIYNAPM